MKLPNRIITASARSVKLLVAASLLLAGCLSSILPKDEQIRHYTLPHGQFTAAAEPTLAALVIDEPTPAPLLESDRLLAVSGDGEVQRIASARWVALPAQLVQDGLVLRLRAQGIARSVDRRALRFRSSLRLTGVLGAFQYDPDARSTRVALDVHLVCTTQARSLGQRRFVAEQSSDSSDANAIVAGLGLALDALSLELADWMQTQAAGSCDDDHADVDIDRTRDGLESPEKRARKR